MARRVAVILRVSIFLMVALALGLQPATAQKPNVIVILVDDLGYADIGPFGKPPYPTPELDRMAREGRTLTDFLVSSAVCSASRAALMTGCYHLRVGISGALGPQAKLGLSASETTIAEICRERGYATACIGKWHLGSEQPFLPLQHGFDEYLGLPYSNDMWPWHPELVKLPADAAARKRGYPPLPLLRGNSVIDPEVTPDDQCQLTTQYTQAAVQFIQANQQRPFFLYVAHSMVHVPLFVSEAHRGKSGSGLFGDVMLELDWSVGQILQTLRDLKLDSQTLVIFTSDNGPWLSYGNHAGSAHPLREGKGTSFEGGIRVPTIAWWPGKIPAGTSCPELASTIDLLPTITELVGGTLPDKPIDGKNIGPLLFALNDEEKLRSPHDAFYCYYGQAELQAVRDRRWKLVFPHTYRTLGKAGGGQDGSPAAYQQAQAERALYDLQSDPGESRNVLDQYPEIVARLEGAAERARTELGDTLTKRTGNAVRPAEQLK